jgi:hypothetical protein
MVARWMRQCRCSPILERLVGTFDAIYTTRMQGLPFVSPNLASRRSRSSRKHRLGVLLTPWSMRSPPLSPRDLVRDRWRR